MDEKTEASVLRDIGDRLRAYRLQQNLPAEVLAKRAGVSRTTLHAAETGRDVRLGSLLRILGALGRLDAVDAFLPVPAASPMEMLRRGTTRPRERARTRRNSASGRTPVPGAPVLPPEGVKGLRDDSADVRPGGGE